MNSISALSPTTENRSLSVNRKEAIARMEKLCEDANRVGLRESMDKMGVFRSDIDALKVVLDLAKKAPAVVGVDLSFIGAVTRLKDYKDGQAIMWRESFPKYGFCVEYNHVVQYRNYETNGWQRDTEPMDLFVDDVLKNDWVVEEL